MIGNCPRGPVNRYLVDDPKYCRDAGEAIGTLSDSHKAQGLIPEAYESPETVIAGAFSDAQSYQGQV